MTTQSPAPVVRHARLTRSQIRAHLTPAARVILAAVGYLLKVGEERSLSHRSIARQARVSPGTVSRLMPALCAEPGNADGNTVPFLRRRQVADGTYLITLLPAPEARGWYHHEPAAAEQPETSNAGASFAPAVEGDAVVLADQLDFLSVLDVPGRSTIDHPIEISVCGIEAPQTDPKTRSIVDHPHPLYIHDQKLASEPVAIAPSGHRAPGTGQPQTRTTEAAQSDARTPTPSSVAPPPPADPRVAELAQRGVFTGLARRVLAARPELTLPEFDRLAGVVASRGRARLAPPVIVASVLARGEQLDEGGPTGYHAGAAPSAPTGPRVSDSEILFARIDSQTKAEWLARFRNAQAPDRPALLVRFRREVLGLTPAGVA